MNYSFSDSFLKLDVGCIISENELEAIIKNIELSGRNIRGN